MGTLLRSELRKDIGTALQKKRGQMIAIDPNLFHGCDGIGLASATYGHRRPSSCIAGRADPDHGRFPVLHGRSPVLTADTIRTYLLYRQPPVRLAQIGSNCG